MQTPRGPRRTWLFLTGPWLFVIIVSAVWRNVFWPMLTSGLGIPFLIAAVASVVLATFLVAAITFTADVIRRRDV